MAKVMNIAEIRNKIVTFSPNRCKHGSLGIRKVLLQLFGYAGDGKSFLIDSCMNILCDKEYVQYARPEQSLKPRILYRTLYHLTSTIDIVDNSGSAKMETREMCAQLVNLVPLNTVMEWPKTFEEMVNKFEQGEDNANFSDLTIPVFVYSVVRKLQGEDKDVIRTFIQMCRKIIGVAPTIVLTYTISEDLYNMEKAFRRMGADEIYTLRLYTDGNLQRNHTKEEILRFLYGTVQDATFQVEEQQRDPRREKSEMKNFLLKYFHTQDMSKKEMKMAQATKDLHFLVSGM